MRAVTARRAAAALVVAALAVMVGSAGAQAPPPPPPPPLTPPPPPSIPPNNPPKPMTAVMCIVPNLKKLTKSKAIASLKKANCAAGKVTKPKKKKKKKTLKVKSQDKMAGTVLPAGSKITFKLRY